MEGFADSTRLAAAPAGPSAPRDLPARSRRRDHGGRVTQQAGGRQPRGLAVPAGAARRADDHQRRAARSSARRRSWTGGAPGPERLDRGHRSSAANAEARGRDDRRPLRGATRVVARGTSTDGSRRGRRRASDLAARRPRRNAVAYPRVARRQHGHVASRELDEDHRAADRGRVPPGRPPQRGRVVRPRPRASRAAANAWTRARMRMTAAWRGAVKQAAAVRPSSSSDAACRRRSRKELSTTPPDLHAPPDIGRADRGSAALRTRARRTERFIVHGPASCCAAQPGRHHRAPTTPPRPCRYSGRPRRARLHGEVAQDQPDTIGGRGSSARDARDLAQGRRTPADARGGDDALQRGDRRGASARLGLHDSPTARTANGIAVYGTRRGCTTDAPRRSTRRYSAAAVYDRMCRSAAAAGDTRPRSSRMMLVSRGDRSWRGFRPSTPNRIAARIGRAGTARSVGPARSATGDGQRRQLERTADGRRPYVVHRRPRESGLAVGRGPGRRC